MSRILVTGIQGQLGRELQKVLSSHEVVVGTGRDRLDFSQPETIRNILPEIEPDIAINAAAYTAVDKAESEPELANTINGIAPGVLAEETEKLGIPLIHVSTDYVFDGSQSRPYLETDPTNPLGIYGASKLAGENAIRDAGDRHIIIRTAWVYGTGGKGNFVKTMLRLGGDRPDLKVVCDQIGSPTWTGDLASAIGQIVRDRLDLNGTYHYTNSGVASWYDFAIAIFEEARSLEFPLQVDRVFPIVTSEYPTPAKRPPFSVLNSRKLADALGSPPPYWRDGLRKMLSEWRSTR